MSVLAAAGATVIPVSLPITEETAESVAVRDWLPAVFKVAPFVNVCTPASPGVKV
jgi:hypothetical protein